MAESPSERDLWMQLNETREMAISVRERFSVHEAQCAERQKALAAGQQEIKEQIGRIATMQEKQATMQDRQAAVSRMLQWTMMACLAVITAITLGKDMPASIWESLVRALIEAPK